MSAATINDERIDVKLAHEDYINEICIHISKLGKSKQKQTKVKQSKKTTKNKHTEKE